MAGGQGALRGRTEEARRHEAGSGARPRQRTLFPEFDADRACEVIWKYLGTTTRDESPEELLEGALEIDDEPDIPGGTP